MEPIYKRELYLEKIRPFARDTDIIKVIARMKWCPGSVAPMDEMVPRAALQTAARGKIGDNPHFRAFLPPPVHQNASCPGFSTEARSAPKL